MGSEQEVEPSSIPMNTDLRSPHSPAVTRLRAWTANNGRTIKAFATAWYSMEQEFDAGLGRGRHCLSVDLSLSEKEKFNAESVQLQAGKVRFQ
jgi:hypothetical protein